MTGELEKLEGRALVDYVERAAGLESARFGYQKMTRDLEEECAALGVPKTIDNNAGLYFWGGVLALVVGLAWGAGSFLLEGGILRGLLLFFGCFGLAPILLIIVGILYPLLSILERANKARERQEDEARVKEELAKKAYLTSVITNQITPLQREVERKMEELYSAGVVFPKYREFVAMNQIAEYLASGRCSTLTGPDGAYNLYESELRLNRISDKLDVIISQLDELNRTMSYVASALSYIGSCMDGIHREVQGINANTASIAASAAVTSYNSRYVY